ncbi:hypothetical protein 2011_scaffold152_00034 [Bacteriophage sp.]|nr:hypothetical protein 2011_scaffold152_00034 [Bacteriophage sp.]
METKDATAVHIFRLVNFLVQLMFFMWSFLLSYISKSRLACWF